jgi:hypothetical protein
MLTPVSVVLVANLMVPGSPANTDFHEAKRQYRFEHAIPSLTATLSRQMRVQSARPSLRSVRKARAACAGAVLGIFVGAPAGAALGDKSGDSPGFVGGMVGASIGAAIGGIIGWHLAR